MQNNRTEEVLERSVEILESATVDGWRVPNLAIYPHQWLWDSCFHAIALAVVGMLDEAVEELEKLFSAQTPEGFLPHMVHHSDPDAAVELWGQPHVSTITQPPMYGHALRIISEKLRPSSPLTERFGALVNQAELGIEWLLRHRRWFDPTPLVIICHPWETGCDDSLRWDGWMRDGVYNRDDWGKRKKMWASASLSFDAYAGRGAVANPAFGVADAGFNALVAFNIVELVAAGGSRRLLFVAEEISLELEMLLNVETYTFDSLPVLPDADPAVAGFGRWDGRRWWRTDSRAADRATSAKTPTLDSTLPALVVGPSKALDAVMAGWVDSERFGAKYGPTGAFRGVRGYDPLTYWRGPAWPQLSYLCWVAAKRSRNDGIAAKIAEGTVDAVLKNDFAEYWHPDTGEGGGAQPQTWSTLAAVMAAEGK